MTTREPSSLFAKLPSQDGLEQVVTTTIAGLTRTNQHAKANIDAMVQCLGEATKGVEGIAAHSVELSKKQWESGMAHANKVADAKNFQELMELQSNWVNASVEMYMGGIRSLGEIAATSMSRASEPLGKRIAASMDSLQTSYNEP